MGPTFMVCDGEDYHRPTTHTYLTTFWRHERRKYKVNQIIERDWYASVCFALTEVNDGSECTPFKSTSSIIYAVGNR